MKCFDFHKPVRFMTQREFSQSNRFKIAMKDAHCTVFLVKCDSGKEMAMITDQYGFAVGYLENVEDEK